MSPVRDGVFRLEARSRATMLYRHLCARRPLPLWRGRALTSLCARQKECPRPEIRETEGASKPLSHIVQRDLRECRLPFTWQCDRHSVGILLAVWRHLPGRWVSVSTRFPDRPGATSSPGLAAVAPESATRTRRGGGGGARGSGIPPLCRLASAGLT